MEGIYKAYFEEIPVLITIHDRELRILDANKRFRDRFGECLGKPCWEAYRGGKRPCSQCVLEETFLTYYRDRPQ